MLCELAAGGLDVDIDRQGSLSKKNGLTSTTTPTRPRVIIAVPMSNPAALAVARAAFRISSYDGRDASISRRPENDFRARLADERQAVHANCPAGDHANTDRL